MKLTLVTGLTGLLLLGTIVELLRRRQLREKYGMLWLAVLVIVIPLSLFPRLLDNVAELLGVASGVSLVLFLGIVFLLLVCVHLSWEVSALEEETRTLAEDFALLRAADRRRTGQPETNWCRPMVNGKRTLIIIPALNESGSIADVVGEVRGELPGVDVLVVDDGSTDRTAAVAAAAGALVAKLPYNLGVGGAMRLGYRYARDHDYDVAIQIDADGQHDPRYVPEARRPARRQRPGHRRPLRRRGRLQGPRPPPLGDGACSPRCCPGSPSTKLTDTTSGFRAANRRVIEMFASWYPAEYLGDTVETLVHTARRGYRIRQVPVAMRKRMAGTPSHSPAKAMIYLGRAFAVLTLALIRR